MMAKTKTTSAHTVEAYIKDLDHPLKALVIALRQCILSSDSKIGEEVKWNVPSFRTHEHFATMHLRASDQISVILHLGAKKRAPAENAITIKDPQTLLKWLGKDRAMVSFQSTDDLVQKQTALVELIQQWIALL